MNAFLAFMGVLGWIYLGIALIGLLLWPVKVNSKRKE
jgi:hypothetical protein